MALQFPTTVEFQRTNVPNFFDEAAQPDAPPQKTMKLGDFGTGAALTVALPLIAVAAAGTAATIAFRAALFGPEQAARDYQTVRDAVVDAGNTAKSLFVSYEKSIFEATQKKHTQVNVVLNSGESIEALEAELERLTERQAGYLRPEGYNPGPGFTGHLQDLDARIAEIAQKLSELRAPAMTQEPATSSGTQADAPATEVEQLPDLAALARQFRYASDHPPTALPGSEEYLAYEEFMNELRKALDEQLSNDSGVE